MPPVLLPMQALALANVLSKNPEVIEMVEEAQEILERLRLTKGMTIGKAPNLIVP